MIRENLKGRLATAAIAAVWISSSGQAALADAHQTPDERQAALEARVAELEALVRELSQRRTPQVAARGASNWEALPASPGTVGVEDRKHNTHAFKIGGYVKADAIFSDFSAGDVAPGSIGSTFYVPATIPVGDDSNGEGYQADFQMRETRINFRSDHALASGHELTTFLELDFIVTPDGNERISNSWEARVRHAFVKFDNWLFGQAWTTFQDVGALPENLDFVGPAEGTAFGRQAMIRYSNGGWDVALENPETTITPFGGGARIVTDDGAVPDAVARYTHKLPNGYIKAAGLLRQLTYDIGGASDEATGYGLSVSGKHVFGRDDLRWMVTVGSGMGRYMGLNASNGAVLDAAGNLETIDQIGGFASFRHFWNDRWHSNFTLSYLSTDNDTMLTGTEVSKTHYSIHTNLLFEPVPKLTVGGELVLAHRELESGVDGDLTRFLFSAKYGF